MSISRKFLGWKTPFLKSTAKFLCDQAENENVIDLSSYTCVLQVSRAGRRLLELLVEEAEKRNKFLIPPEIINVGSLPERIITGSKPLVSDLKKRLFYLEALRSAKKETLSKIITTTPSKNDLYAWLSYVDDFIRLENELAGSCLRFRDVKVDEERFLALDDLREGYLARLSESGLGDRNEERFAALELSTFSISKCLVLLSTTELNEISTSLLRKVSSPVVSLVNAEEDYADHFDEFGRILKEKWLDEKLDILQEQISVVDSPEIASESIVDFFVQQNAKYELQELGIGSTTQEFIPYIKESLQNEGIVSQDPSSKSLANSDVVLLLTLLEKYLSSRSYFDFASLLRHVDLQVYLDEVCNFKGSIQILDKYYNEHLPAKLEGEVFEADKISAKLNQLLKIVEPLFEGFKKSEVTFAEFSETLSKFLITVYRDEERSKVKDKELGDVFSKVASLLDDYSSFDFKKISPAQALKLFISATRSELLAAEYLEEALEILGWLELQLDDAKVLSICGLNEGYVPESINSDAFLPNSTRVHLGLMDNDRRYARDLFILRTLLESKDKLQLIACKRNSNADVLLPSRLLYACDNLPQRVLSFYEDSKTHRHSHEPATKSFSLPVEPDVTDFEVEQISVTSFRTYLSCPYRFYLDHILKLENVDDESKEMNALLFGNLAHDVLNAFAKSEFSNSTSASEIFLILEKSLNDLSFKRFARNALPSVYLQVEQLRERLRYFADWQAQHRSAGWEIVHSELKLPNGAIKLENGKSIEIIGRVDRVDQNKKTGEWAIFDYKTGDKSETPKQAHQRQGEWKDLQLPIYSFVLRRAGIVSETPRLGFIQIGSEPIKIGADLAKWTKEEIEEAEEVMIWVAEQVSEKVFWPPKDVGFGKYRTLYSKLQEEVGE